MNKTWLVIIFSVLALLGISVTVLRPSTPSSTNPTPTPSVSLSDSQTVVDEKTLGFTLSIPKEYIVEKSGSQSRLIIKPSNNQDVGPTNFLYISVIPTSQNNEEGTIYNYSKSDMQKLIQLQIGKSIVLGATSVASMVKYFTYTRIDDAMMGGFGTKVYRNDSPWEFPSGTTEYRYIIEFAGVTYLFGAYVQPDTGNPGGIKKSEADSIFYSLKVNPQLVQSLHATPYPEGEWKTHSDEKNGFSLQYPGNWKTLKDSQFFENGDIFAIQVIGTSQRPQSEMHDGVNFAVMKPIKTDLDALSWMRSKYSAGEPIDPDRPPKYESLSFSGKRFEKVTVCGLGCFPYYHIKQNGMVYGFLGFAVGPSEQSYESAISKILSSITFIQ